MFLTFNINDPRLNHKERYTFVSGLLPFWATVQRDECPESRFPMDTSKASTSDTNGHPNSSKGNLDEHHWSVPVICENSGTDRIIAGYCQREFNLSITLIHLHPFSQALPFQWAHLCSLETPWKQLQEQITFLHQIRDVCRQQTYLASRGITNQETPTGCHVPAQPFSEVL